LDVLKILACQDVFKEGILLLFSELLEAFGQFFEVSFFVLTFWLLFDLSGPCCWWRVPLPGTSSSLVVLAPAFLLGAVV
jgi:hypothetical protein